MKKMTIRLILAMMLLLPSYASAQDNSVYKKVFDEYLEVSGSNAQVRNTLDQMIPMLRTSFAQAPTEFTEKFIKKYTELFGTRYGEMLMPIVQKYYSLGELKEVVAFFKTDLGQKMSKNNTLITTESMKLVQELGQTLALEVIQELQKEGVKMQ